MTTDEAKKAELMKRLEKDYPESPAVKAPGRRAQQREAVGKPFEIEFTDAIKGAPGLDGQPQGQGRRHRLLGDLVRPLRRRDAQDEEALRRVQGQGRRVHRRQPRPAQGRGRATTSSRTFVEKNKIEWPQYYQGKGWQSDFSTSWGINSIPSVFLVDADGKLAIDRGPGQARRH